MLSRSRLSVHGAVIVMRNAYKGSGIFIRHCHRCYIALVSTIFDSNIVGVLMPPEAMYYLPIGRRAVCVLKLLSRSTAICWSTYIPPIFRLSCARIYSSFRKRSHGCMPTRTHQWTSLEFSSNFVTSFEATVAIIKVIDVLSTLKTTLPIILLFWLYV